MPLVGAEVQRVRQAFALVSDELGGARRAVRTVDTGSVGTPACDAAVSEGLRDLVTALERLEATAAECVLALGRHEVFPVEGDS